MGKGVTVTPYQPANVRTPAVPGGGYIDPNTGVGDFGQALGVGLRQTGSELRALSVDIQQEVARDNEAAVADIDGQARRRLTSFLSDPEKGFLSLKGAAAVEGSARALQDLEALRTEYLGLAGSDKDRRRMADKAVGARFDAALQTITDHTRVQRLAWQTSTFDARIENAQADAIAAAGDDRAVVEQLRVIAEAASRRAELDGLSGEAKEAFLRKHRGDALKGVLGRMMLQDPDRAAAWYQRNQRHFDPKDAPAIEAHLKHSVEGRAVARNAAGFNPDAENAPPVSGGNYDYNIGNITTSRFNYAGGKGQPRGSFETFETPAHGVAAAYITMQAKARQNGGQLSFLELIGGTAKVGGWAPADTSGGTNPLLRGNNPQAYAMRLAGAVGLKPGDALPLDDDAKMATILAEMNRVEKGKTTVPQGSFAEGIRLAKGGGRAVAAGGAAADDVTSTSFGRGSAAVPGAPVAAPALPTTLARPEPRLAAYEAEVERLFPKASADPILREKQRAALHARYAQDHAAWKDGRDKSVTDAVEWVISHKGQPLTSMPAAMWLALDLEAQEKMRAAAKKAANEDAVTDRPTWYKLYAMATDPDQNVRQAFAKINLLEYTGLFAKNDFEEMAKLQGAIRKGDPEGVVDGESNYRQQIEAKLLSLGLDATPRPGSQDAKDREAFFIEANKRLRQASIDKGRKLDVNERQDLVDQLAKPVPGTSGWLGSDRIRARVTIGDVPKDVVAKWDPVFTAERVPGVGALSDDVRVSMWTAMQLEPSLRTAGDDLPKLVAALIKKGVPVTETSIVNGWREVQRARAARAPAAVVLPGADAPPAPTSQDFGAYPLADAPPPINPRELGYRTGVERRVIEWWKKGVGGVFEPIDKKPARAR